MEEVFKDIINPVQECNLVFFLINAALDERCFNKKFSQCNIHNISLIAAGLIICMGAVKYFVTGNWLLYTFITFRQEDLKPQIGIEYLYLLMEVR